MSVRWTQHFSLSEYIYKGKFRVMRLVTAISATRQMLRHCFTRPRPPNWVYLENGGVEKVDPPLVQSAGGAVIHAQKFWWMHLKIIYVLGNHSPKRIKLPTPKGGNVDSAKPDSERCTVRATKPTVNERPYRVDNILPQRSRSRGNTWAESKGAEMDWTQSTVINTYR